MAHRKATFTLDEATMRELEEAARCLAWSKSAVLREAIHDFHLRVGKLSERERLRLLKVLDELLPRIPSRPVAEVEAELSEIRRARRTGGRATSGGRR